MQTDHRNPFGGILAITIALALLRSPPVLADPPSGKAAESARAPQQEERSKLKEWFIGAAKSGSFARLRELLDQGADVNWRDENGWRALHHAAASDYPTASAGIKVLLDAGAIVEVRTPIWELTPLMLAGSIGRDASKITIMAGSDRNARDALGNTPLHWGVRPGWGTSNLDKADALTVPTGPDANINAANVWGWTPLMEACRNGNAAIVEFLLKNRADPNMTNDEGWTPLMIAVGSSDPEVWKRWSQRDRKWLLGKGYREEDVEHLLVHFYGSKEFDDVTTFGQVGRVWALLKYDAKADVTAKDGTTVYTLLEGRTNPSAMAIRKLLEIEIVDGDRGKSRR